MMRGITALPPRTPSLFEGTEGFNYSQFLNSSTRTLESVATIAFSARVQNEDAEVKMQEDIERKQELESAIKEYLSHAEMYSSRDSWKLHESGDYVFAFCMLSFSNQDDPEIYYFLAPQHAERKLIDEVDRLFDSQVSPATIRGSLQGAIDVIHENTKFVFPFETDDQVQQYHDKIYELLNPYYDSRCDALVPMYQLDCAYGVEFPLANAVLYSGSSHSQLAKIANDDAYYFRDTDSQQIETCSFLKFPVSGDSAIRLEQVEYEAERALQVLRFIYPWFEKDGKSYNPAHGVSMWKHSDRIIAYERTPEARVWSPWYAEIPNGIFGVRSITAETLIYAQKVRGLDDINYHIQNSECNPVSQRICRALSFYDTAAQTSIGQIAFSNFVISIDILFPAKSVAATVLTGCLGTLIEHGKFYTGEMNLDAELADPELTKWSERVRLTTADFRDFYATRGQILHGNEEQRYKTRISKLQVKKARQIAHNAIRAYAHLARAFQWENDGEPKKWFKQPCKPPK